MRPVFRDLANPELLKKFLQGGTQNPNESVNNSEKKIETELIKENIDMNQLSILKTQFIDKFQRLDICQNQISEQLLGTEDAVQEYLDDMEEAENYRDR
ncbi:hypothetical protein TNCV_3179601 [Trichonephila clavipes]|nr:hypothetical protein TNCV_3179601 [Trichonephila clavipes]